MTYKELIEKAIKEKKDNDFIELLKKEPFYPIEHTDHNVREFGRRIKFIGDTSITGIKQKEEGYILGIARNKKKIGRDIGWMEVCFFDLNVYGLYFEDIEF